MKSYFTSDFFVGNRAALRRAVGASGPIVITANGLLQRGGDSSFPFAQDANFWYLTGIHEPDVTLVLDDETEYLIVPARSDSRQAFDGSIDVTALAERSGIVAVLAEKEGWKRLSARLKKTKHIVTIAPPAVYLDHYGLYTNPARAHLLDRAKASVQTLEVQDISLELARMRMVKQPAELQAIQSAIDITLATIKHVSKPGRLAKYAHEYEIEADITRSFRKRGAQGHSFEPIVASGAQAVTLHNVANNGPLTSADLLIWILVLKSSTTRPILPGRLV